MSLHEKCVALAQWSVDLAEQRKRDIDANPDSDGLERSEADHALAQAQCELDQLRRTDFPRVLKGDWETVRDALDALPEGAQIRWTTGDPIHVALGINRGAYWNVTTPGGPLSSDNIARDETPIEVIA